MPVVDMTGKDIDRLHVLERSENDNQGNAMWLCLCECGNKTIVRGGALRQKKTRSCGCLLSEKSKERMIKISTKHGNYYHPLYRVYHSMLNRCNNPDDKGYHNYGGRGIRVCDEWYNRFESFYYWAIANGYKNGLEIDRRNNDGNYDPSNCHFVKSIENCQNTRSCRKIISCEIATGNEIYFNSINEASRISGVNPNTIRRILKGIPTKETKFTFKEI